MFVFIVFVSCLFYPFSSGQANNSATYPTLGSVLAVPNNDSVLNFTFVYPNNYQFANLFVRFTVYDFVDNNKLNPQPFSFSWANFTSSNTSLPWVVPSAILQSGDYIITCFEWVQTDMNSSVIFDQNECILSRTAMNSTLLPMVSWNASAPMVTNTTASVMAYFPAALPFDLVTITSNLNSTILPTMTNSSSNSTYMNMSMFTYMNLSPGTYYNLCIYYDYQNSLINGTEQIDTECQMIMTVGSTPPADSTPPAGSTPPTGISNKMISNSFIMILMLIFIFM